jgi:flagellin-like protein
MKKIWKSRRNNEAVSPVIATILMVAITVVLAAVLYVMVLGINTGVGQNIVISFTKSSTSTNWTLDTISVSGTTQLAKADCNILVKKADGTTGMAQVVLSTMTSGTYYSGVRWLESGATTTAQAQVNAGDSITLDRTIYLIGSTVVITSLDGKNTYASVTI